MSDHIIKCQECGEELAGYSEGIPAYIVKTIIKKILINPCPVCSSYQIVDEITS